MNVKRVILGALTLTLLAGTASQAQSPAMAVMDKEAARLDMPSPPPDMAPNGSPYGTGLSPWITYSRQGCCGQLGGDGPIQSETYIRTGPSLPIEGAFFGHTLETGWLIQGGGRVLFFDPPQERAWTVDLSISNIYNHGQRSDLTRTLTNLAVPSPIQIGGQAPNNIIIPSFPVTVHYLNRTFANLGFGQEYYLWGAANTNDPACRIGWDFGGRWGSANLALNELRHRTDVIGGVFWALHTDYEIPWGKVLFTGGFRLEWDYTWSDVLHDADVEDLNFLITAGVRF